MIDVCLLLEGTYPYVAGGVSTWVHQLITAMKDLRFGIVYVTTHSDPTRQLKYEVPSHVLYLKEVYLHDYDLEPSRTHRPRRHDIAAVQKFYEELLQGNLEGFPQFLQLVRGATACLDVPTFFTSKAIWQLLLRFYERYAEEISFLDYFWTWRGTHLPLLQVLRAELPPAKIYHAISTGYAGLLGAIGRVRTGGHFFLTEHGIYTHERMLEISQANWIYERERHRYRPEQGLPFFKRWWVGMFQVMSRLAYRYADRIVTLYEGNKTRQIVEGADPAKIHVIPNGIDRKLFMAVPRERRATPHIALIGRVVAIKDIKTFIYAARLVLEQFPQAQFYIAGPTTEEADYFDECKLLIESLHLEERVTFTGPVDPKDYYRFLDVVVLTSLSEAQPYAVLEAGAVGVPVVATDVGACREMLEGRTFLDQTLGPSGLITEVASPAATAAAIGRLLSDSSLYAACSAAGMERVRLYYDQDDLLSHYLNLYEQHL